MNDVLSYENDEKNAVDNKIIKRHFPRTNNAQVLEFVFEKDPNLFLRKNKILVKGTVEVPDTWTPDTGFVSKLFSMLSIELDSHTISSNRVKLVLKTKIF